MTGKEWAEKLVEVTHSDEPSEYPFTLTVCGVTLRAYPGEDAATVGAVGASVLRKVLADCIDLAIVDAVRLKDPADAPVSEESLALARLDLKPLGSRYCSIPDRDLVAMIDWQAGLIAILMRDEPGTAYLEGVEAGRRAAAGEVRLVTSAIVSKIWCDPPPSSANGGKDSANKQFRVRYEFAGATGQWGIFPDFKSAEVAGQECMVHFQGLANLIIEEISSASAPG